MASVRDVLIYFCQHYPHKAELSKARLTKMVYLADWRSAILYGKQVTPIEWHFNRYGPYVRTVESVARVDPAFQVRETVSAYGNFKEVIELSDVTAVPDLSGEEISVLNHVITTTQDLYWDGFMRLVYSTFPVVTQPRYSTLDLVRLAKRYREAQPA